MAKETKTSKWEGKATTELKTTTAERIWPLIEDFCTIHKWLPTLDTCHHVQGINGQPGLIRYCSSTVRSSIPSTPNEVKWCQEKLLSIDPVKRCLSYEIMENNIGFTYYVAELKVIDIDGWCKIEWSFTADPIEGWRLEDLCGHIESSLKVMGERMEKEVTQAITN